jgi:hypothetical protein
MDDDNSTLKSIGAIVLTLALFLGVGWYVYASLFAPPGPQQAQDEIVAVHTQAPATAPANEKTVTQHPG